MLRIWVAFVGQGDGILIQLPEKYNYDPDPEDDDDALSERIDIVIDGGPRGTRMLDFVKGLYPDGHVILEHVVLTHYDSDHLAGLIRLIDDPDIEVRQFHHNGLAIYSSQHPAFPAGSVVTKKWKRKGKPTRSLFAARIVLGSPGGMFAYDTLASGDLVNGLSQLDDYRRKGYLDFVYLELAHAIHRKKAPAPVTRFDNISGVGPFPPAPPASQRKAFQGRGRPRFRMTTLWPERTLRYYRSWSETVNGNSVTLLLEYGDFSMLFTGDQNNLSERPFLASLEDDHRTWDVIKTPHHGSSHNLDAVFVDKSGTRAVLGVASFGGLGMTQYGHPDPALIEKIGGMTRFYSTYLEETAIPWSRIRKDKAVRKRYVEEAHVLIETNGQFFRVVEVDAASDPRVVPRVRDVATGDGTLWIGAKN